MIRPCLFITESSDIRRSRRVIHETLDGIEEMVILPQTGGMTVFFPVGLGMILITWGCGIKKKE